jgi:hypothetical protein
VISAAIIIAFRDRGVDPLRQKNLDCVRDYWAGSGLPVHVVDDGRTGDEHFNRHAAYNRGAAATDADVLCYIESDILLDYQQLNIAIESAASQLGQVVPFEIQRKLTREGSELVRDGADPVDVDIEQLIHTAAGGVNHGCANVISRETLNLVGRWDEAFEGHGHDDTAACIGFAVATGQQMRYVAGFAHHLWHLDFDPTLTQGDHIRPEDAAAQERNLQRLQLYRQARRPEDIRALTIGGNRDWRARHRENDPRAGRYHH